MENVKVPCFTCKGKGEIYLPYPTPGDPGEMRRSGCRTCNGFGVLIATELKRVEKWEQVKRNPVVGICKQCNQPVPLGFVECDGSGSHPAQ